MSLTFGFMFPHPNIKKPFSTKDYTEKTRTFVLRFFYWGFGCKIESMKPDAPGLFLPLSADLLLKAYSLGLFPMAENADSDRVFWCDPINRGIMPIETFHVPRRLEQQVKQFRYTIQTDYAFDQVVAGCADRDETWINQTIQDLYQELFKKGHAHSLECWHDDQLIAGVYGVSLGGAFFAESMFTRQDNASKIALVHLMARLWTGGYQLVDTQFMNDHIQQFGAIEISQEDYKDRLSRALLIQAHWVCSSDSSSSFSSEEEMVLAFLQSRTQIS